jgi:hypothetical protein
MTRTQELIIELEKTMRPEVLGATIGKSVATISLWKAGKRQAKLMELAFLERLVKHERKS